MSGWSCAIGGDGQLFQGLIKLERMGGPGAGKHVLQEALARLPARQAFCRQSPEYPVAAGREADLFSLVTPSSFLWHRDSRDFISESDRGSLMTALPGPHLEEVVMAGGRGKRVGCGEGGQARRALCGPTALQQKPNN